MKEWYLTIPRPDITSGFEGDAISEYAQSNFLDVLETDFCNRVLLYNHDLTESREIHCVIQNNTADTQLKSMERTILTPIGLLHSGDYIFFEDEYWIVDGRPGNNKSYEKATLKECQYKIKWQKSNGDIVERWANLTSASKYDIGEGGNNVLFLSSNNFTIVIPHDADSLTIDGKRVFIDTSSNPKKVFKITRNDDVLFTHPNHGGTLSLIADKTELNPDTDRVDLRLCNYINIDHIVSSKTLISEKHKTINAKIVGQSNMILGYEYTYVANLVKKDGTPAKWDSNHFSWQVTSDFPIEHSINENIIRLIINEKHLNSHSFLLQIIYKKEIVIEKQITISEIV